MWPSNQPPEVDMITLISQMRNRSREVQNLPEDTQPGSVRTNLPRAVCLLRTLSDVLCASGMAPAAWRVPLWRGLAPGSGLPCSRGPGVVAPPGRQPSPSAPSCSLMVSMESGSPQSRSAAPSMSTPAHRRGAVSLQKRALLCSLF